MLVGTGILAMKDGAARTTLKDAMDETEMVIFDVVENLLRNNNVDPQEVITLSLDTTRTGDKNLSWPHSMGMWACRSTLLLFHAAALLQHHPWLPCL